MAAVDVKGILQDIGQRYHIEYKHHLSNHAAHAAVALARLGASRERVQEYVDWYAEAKLVTKEHRWYKDELAKEGEDFSDISKIPVGGRIKFYPLLELIEKEIEANGGNYKPVVAKFFPTVSDGLVASLLHGLIHLGYGIAGDCSNTVAQGLAYMHHSFVSAYISDPETNNSRSVGNLGKGTSDPFDVLEKVRDNQDLRQAMLEKFKSEEVQSRKVGAAQQRIMSLFLTRSKEIQEYVDSIKVPDGILDPLDVDALGSWIVDMAFLVYLCFETKNDFFILHGVTSAWSLKQVLPLLASSQEVLRAARTFLVTLVAVYISRDSPKLNRKALEEYTGPHDESFWNEVKKEQAERMCDEHFYKLVQVAYDMWKANPKSARLYAAAAHSCRDNMLYLSPENSYPPDDRKTEMTTKKVEAKVFGNYFEDW